MVQFCHGSELWEEARSTESTLRLGRGALTNINALNAFLYDIKDLCERYTAELTEERHIATSILDALLKLHRLIVVNFGLKCGAK